MEITTRQRAITGKLNKYFTGEPCKSGHISERYTRTSNCLECLHPKFENVEMAERKELRRRVGIAKLQMGRFTIAVHTEDLVYFREIIYLLSTIREPSLDRKDILTNVQPKHRGGSLYLYAFKVFPEDKEALIQIKLDLDWNYMTPDEQARVIEAQPRRIDGWVPPPLRLISYGSGK